MCFAFIRIDEQNGGEAGSEISGIAGVLVLNSQPLDMKIGNMNNVAAEINKKDFKVSEVVKNIKKIYGVIAVKVLDEVGWLEEKIKY